MKNKQVAAEQTAEKLGKFNTADDLLAAYNALETEFTKRCQLIKELQAALAEKSAQEDKAVENPPDNNGVSLDEASGELDENAPEQGADDGVIPPDAPPENAQSAAQKIACAVAEACPHDRCERRGEERGEPVSAENVLEIVAANIAEFAELLSELPEIESVCIARYKKRLLDGRTVVPSGGYAVITPAKRPKSLTDAKRLADELLAGN